MAKGGAIKPVVVVTDAELQVNGGRYLIKGGPVLAVEGIAAADIGENENISGGELMPVYVITVLDGTRRLQGGKPVKMSEVAATRKTEGRVAQPVYVVSGSLG